MLMSFFNVIHAHVDVRSEIPKNNREIYIRE
jgi:hypothetical protein